MPAHYKNFFSQNLESHARRHILKLNYTYTIDYSAYTSHYPLCAIPPIGGSAPKGHKAVGNGPQRCCRGHPFGCQVYPRTMRPHGRTAGRQTANERNPQHFNRQGAKFAKFNAILWHVWCLGGWYRAQRFWSVGGFTSFFQFRRSRLAHGCVTKRQSLADTLRTPHHADGKSPALLQYQSGVNPPALRKRRGASVHSSTCQRTSRTVPPSKRNVWCTFLVAVPPRSLRRMYRPQCLRTLGHGRDCRRYIHMGGGRKMAERQGFEPWVRLPVHGISSAAHSTTLSPLRSRGR